MPGRQPLPIGTVLAGDVRIVSLIDDGALGYIYGVEKGAAKERGQLVEFCPRVIAARAPDGAVFGATPEATETLRVCLERFVRDAEALRAAPHANIQPVLAVLTGNGTAYALQPPEQGRTLAAVANSLQRLPSEAELDKVLRPLVSALGHLHAHGLVHANITPDTILIGPGVEPQLIRFGGTRAFVAARTRAQHAAVTAGYSAPELYLFDERGQGPLSDVFSLAATLYRLVTGRAPADVIQRSLGEAVPPAARTQGAYRAGLLRAIDAGMALEPKLRPQSMAAFGALLLEADKPAGLKPEPVAAAGAAAAAAAAAAKTQVIPAAAAPPVPAAPAAPVSPPPTRAASPAPTPASALGSGREPAKVSGNAAEAVAEAKPRLAVVPKPDVDTRTQKPAVGDRDTGFAAGLGALFPGSYRLAALGLGLALLLAAGMWQLDHQLKSEGKPAAMSKEAAAQKPVTAEQPKRADAEAKSAEPAGVAAERKLAEARALAERKAAEERAAQERKAAEERAEADRKAAAERRVDEERAAAEARKAAEIERQKEQARSEEAARSSEAARQQKARLAAVSNAADRDIVLALRSDDDAVNTAVEKRLAELGYLNVVTSAGDKWLKPGDGEAFRDCETCPEMVLVPAPARVASAAAKPGGAAPPPATAASARAASPSAALAVGRTEITRDEFAAFVADTGYDTSGGCYARTPDWKLDPQLSWKTPGFEQDGRHPVVCVSFIDAKAYAAWLSLKAKQAYRLPSEAEWEHAARSNTASAVRFPFGNDEREICNYANGADESARAAFPGWQTSACSDGFTHTAPAGTFKPNHFGLYDTMGNAWEWVDECAPPPAADGAVHKADCTAASPRILKGGSYSDRPELLEPQARSGAEPNVRDEIAGFRIVRAVEVRPLAGSGSAAK